LNESQAARKVAILADRFLSSDGDDEHYERFAAAVGEWAETYIEYGDNEPFDESLAEQPAKSMTVLAPVVKDGDVVLTERGRWEQVKYIQTNIDGTTDRRFLGVDGRRLGGYDENELVSVRCVEPEDL